MAESKKTIEAWEKEKGVIISGEVELKSKLTEDEFNELALERGIGVNFEDRTKFLKDNGYTVSRENMVNSELSIRS